MSEPTTDPRPLTTREEALLKLLNAAYLSGVNETYQLSSEYLRPHLTGPAAEQLSPELIKGVKEYLVRSLVLMSLPRYEATPERLALVCLEFPQLSDLLYPEGKSS